MRVNYKNFMKHAEKVTKGVGASRPILEGVEHKDDGTLTVTDSHRLYRAYNVNAPSNAVINPTTGEEIDAGTYPDTDRIIPDFNNAGRTYGVRDHKTVIATLKAMKQVAVAEGIKYENARIKIRNGHMELAMDASKLNIEVSYPLLPFNGTEEIEVLVSLKYMLETFEMFQDIATKQFTGYTYIDLTHKHKPIGLRLEGCEDLTAIILPCREY